MLLKKYVSSLKALSFDLRCVSVIAPHPTPEMVLRSVIFSTLESGKIIKQLDTKCTPTAHLNILRSGYLFVAKQAFLKK